MRIGNPTGNAAALDTPHVSAYCRTIIMNKSLIIVLAGILAACSSSAPPAETGNPDGKPLMNQCPTGEDSDCASGLCSHNLSPDQFPYSNGPGGGPLYCTLECTSDADCETARCPDFLRYKHDCSNEPIKCLTTVDGAFCMPPCQDGEGGWLGWKCIDGVPVNCEKLDESHCEICGCPEGNSCKNDTCVPKRQIGETCDDGRDCVSPYRCGPTEADPSVKKCLVAAGEPCTPDNCENCVENGQWCSVRCETDSKHENCDYSDTTCIGDYSGYWWCAPKCSRAEEGSDCRPPKEHLKCHKLDGGLVETYACY